MIRSRLRYDYANTQRQRDKQRLTDLERSVNDERLNKQRLESQIKTEKTITKKLQDDLTKLSLTPTKSVLTFAIDRTCGTGCFCI